MLGVVEKAGLGGNWCNKRPTATTQKDGGERNHAHADMETTTNVKKCIIFILKYMAVR